jgi:hypothetical protein
VLERVRAGLAGMTLLLLLTTIGGLTPVWMPLTSLFFVLAANWRLFGTFRSVRGSVFGLSALMFHQLYYLYSTAAFVWCWCEARLLRTVRT